jgi:hypothetical protein
LHRKSVILFDMTLNFTDQIRAAKEAKTLNKPFRTPGGPKKFSVYVKNDKGNVVKVNFGDPNMKIKRGSPARRKSFRARHHCESPGPKWKARYWSCYQWRAGAPVQGSEEVTMSLEAEAAKGLWYNIQKKKERMGKNYKPAKPGDKAYPEKEAWKKAQAEEWDGITFWDQAELLKIWPELAKADDIAVDKDPEEMLFNSQEAAEMAVTIFSSGAEKMSQMIEAIKSDATIASRCSDPWALSDIALLENYINSIHGYLMYPKEGFASITKNGLERDFEIGSKVKNINPSCKHYGSEGVVEEVKDLPDEMGQVVKYKVTNDGDTYKKGDTLTKTIDQLTNAALFQPPLILNKHNTKLVDQAYKTIVEPSLEKEHGEREGAFTEDDLEYQMEYKKTVHIDYPVESMITKDKIFTPKELDIDLKERPGNSLR